MSTPVRIGFIILAYFSIFAGLSHFLCLPGMSIKDVFLDALLIMVGVVIVLTE